MVNGNTNVTYIYYNLELVSSVIGSYVWTASQRCFHRVTSTFFRYRAKSAAGVGIPITGTAIAASLAALSASSFPKIQSRLTSRGMLFGQYDAATCSLTTSFAIGCCFFIVNIVHLVPQPSLSKLVRGYSCFFVSNELNG